MADKKRPGPRDDINKLAIRRDYAQGNTNLSALGKKFGVQRQTIAQWIKKENWGAPKDIADKVQTEIERKAVEAVAEKLTPNIAEGLLRHADIELLFLDVVKTTLEKAKNGTLRPGRASSEAEETLAAVNAAAKALDKSREIHGIRSGQPSVGDAQDDGKRRFTFTVAKAG